MSLDRLEEVRRSFLADLAEAAVDAGAVEGVRVRYAGRRSGVLQDLTVALRELPAEQKRAYGQALNELKRLVEQELEAARVAAESPGAASRPIVDVTLPGRPLPRGAQHPVHLVRQRIEEIFLRMGYDVEDGPEIEDDWHNFEALNIPPDHPARDMQDTFYSGPAGSCCGRTPRPVQIRDMERCQPPIRIIVPGRVYRRRGRSAALADVPSDRGADGRRRGHLRPPQGDPRDLSARASSPSMRSRCASGRASSRSPSRRPRSTCTCMFCRRRLRRLLGLGLDRDPRLGHGRPEGVRGGRASTRSATRASPSDSGLDRVAMLTYGIGDLRLLFAGDQRLTRQFE